MRQGTTPTLVIHTSGLELEKLTSLYLTIEQNGTTLTKRMEDLVIEENTVAVTLTQEETLQFIPGRYQVQIRAITEEGTVIASPILTRPVFPVLYDEFSINPVSINPAEDNENLGLISKSNTSQEQATTTN